MAARASLPQTTMTSVSIIVPCYNEQATIAKLLAAIYAQTYPVSALEVLIADGMSEDSTRQVIASFSTAHPDLTIHLVDNPARIIPAGLNRALKKASGGIIIRLDGHSLPYPDYVERCVADLEAGLGVNVGGVWEIHPGSDGWVAASIAAAAANPLGVGDALYRHATKPASVDTVPFGAFKRELLATNGFFDETLLTNEDYEFNARIRRSGGVIWLDPTIRSVYFARSRFRDLAVQYWRYGFWKFQMLRRYPATLRWRQALPPLFIIGLILGLILTAFLKMIRIPFFLICLAYPTVLLIAGIFTAFKQKKIYLILGLPLAIATMHLSWGSGFLWGMIKRKPSNRSTPDK